MKNIQPILCLLLLSGIYTCSFGQNAADSTCKYKVYVTTNTSSRFPQRSVKAKMSIDSVKADYKRRTGKDLDERFIVLRRDTIVDTRNNGRINH